jgi:hypothetical protein
MSAIRNMADLLREVDGIDLSVLTPSERQELSQSMGSAARVNNALRATASTAQVTCWFTNGGELQFAVINEFQAREDVAGTCTQVFNALQALAPGGAG